MRLSQIQREDLLTWAFKTGDCPAWLSNWAADHYASDIPYGTLTGDDDTIDEWLADHADWVIDYFGLDEHELST